MGGDVSGNRSDGRDGVAQFLIGEAPHPGPVTNIAWHTEVDPLPVLWSPWTRSGVQGHLPETCFMTRVAVGEVPLIAGPMGVRDGPQGCCNRYVGHVAD